MPSNKKNISKFTFFFKKLIHKKNSTTIDNQGLPDRDSVAIPVNLTDEIDGRFKELYPETAVNTASGTPYRMVPTIFGKENKAGTGPIDVNRVVLEVGEPEKREKKGKGAYLFTTQQKIAGQENIENLLVDAHGCFNTEPHDVINLQPGMPAISLLGPHGASLIAPLYQRNVYAEVSHTGITLTSQQAKEDFANFGLEKITGTPIVGAIRNYELGKFAPKPKDPRAVHYVEDMLFEANWQPSSRRRKIGDGKKFDILTVRQHVPNFTARDAVNITQEQNYKKTIFSFCRSDAHSNKLEIYWAKNTTVLTRPVSYTWEKIEEIQAARLAEVTPRPTLG